MFPEISIENRQVSIKFSLIDQLINAKPGGIKFDLSQVTSVEIGPQVLKHLRGLRLPGTYAYFIIGGTYWTSRKNRSFWNARRKHSDRTIQINLSNHRYQFVVIQVADPEKTKELLTSEI